ncbi:helix-turn-helix domain-containing protein [Trichococcus sp.]|uniref:helix-turn-helix domain-containing protein n=1 Tax=Trichococcus sp. TaxID=1985464 RepID=UPI003C7E5BE6
MKVSYKPLWKLLIDREIKQKTLRESAKISSSTFHKLRNNENVTIDILIRICTELHCNFSDIVECVEE